MLGYNFFMEKFSVVIQAGGNSTRMGEDKALVKFMNTTLIEYILSQIQGIGEETIIISKKPESYNYLGYKVFSEILNGVGALGGIYTAIHYASQPKCLLLACDMPFISIPLLNYMLSVDQNADIIIPRLKNKSFSEPFRALYSKNCLPSIKEAIERGNKRVISFFEQVNTKYVEYDEIIRIDPKLRSFTNINTPEDLLEAEKIAIKI